MERPIVIDRIDLNLGMRKKPNAFFGEDFEVPSLKVWPKYLGNQDYAHTLSFSSYIIPLDLAQRVAQK